ncbi:UDP-N-acetylmuramate dehydrogenase [Patescibacteria group bacterium]|nr:UDP-N-acetylmuramate dehydrogenase [Patescibacteria group bacterium]MDE1946820.1 UDP-N-acetylmuramate dehydrogenase [Patescibacteria group bacterium]MDE2011158.1 UDP-N-acetylmuramate dehydrogenase [Patescibacteria group bacterium]MDE2233067.1 UDP-N-acetylmuramate dehydrogenase [Patescibacteria group bacterium]
MKISKNILLAQYTTFKIGGPARFFCAVADEKELVEAVKFAKEKSLRIFVLGGGSNILVSDDGFSGLVIKNEMKGVGGGNNFYFKTDEEAGNALGGGNSIDNESIAAAAGEIWDDLVKYTVERNLAGIENLSGIPGTVGAAPVQNIGAYGTDAAQTIETVRVLDLNSMKFKELTNKECEFGYRDSIFKKQKGRYIVTAVSFRLKKGGRANIDYADLQEYFGRKQARNPMPKTAKLPIFNPKRSSADGSGGAIAGIHAAAGGFDEPLKFEPSIVDVRDAVVEIRRNKLPDWTHWGTAGSYFKNPVVDEAKCRELTNKFPGIVCFRESAGMHKFSLGWIIDKICHMKGVTVGNVGTHDRQALVLIAKPGASAKEVVALSENIMRRVREETGLEIEMEVEWVN